MLMLVDCSKCRIPLQLPPEATKYIKCYSCKTITRIAIPSTGGGDNHHPAPAPAPAPSPSPHNHLPSFGQTPSVNGQKRAVICGISYKGTQGELQGCINDAKCMKYLLRTKFKFPRSSIVMLTEEETDPTRIPTKHNIRMAMHWLVQGCRPGDSLVFHFSGHGGQQKNYTGDEIDGRDETLCPLDHATQGDIVDNEINGTLVRPLPHGVKLHAIIDACHSGTMLDLPFLCRMDRNGRYTWEDHSPQSGAFKGTSGGKVISFSGCDDDQYSADTDSLSKVVCTGAMTFSFIQAIEHGHATTYGDMLTSMRSTIRKNEYGTGSAVAGFRQEPQLTANEPFDVYTKRFSL